MKLKRSHISNGLVAIFILLLIIPQTRKPLQIGFNKVRAMFAPSVSYNNENSQLSEYSWTLLNQKGEQVELEDMQGEVVFVNLWATWCPPCIAEMDAMNDLYKDYKDRVNFLFVSNEDLDHVSAFLHSREWSISNHQPVTKYPAQLSSNSIPATFIIGKDGIIHVSKKGPANWNSESVRNLLDTLIEE